MSRRTRGFTLIEIMIVTAVISILAGMAVPSLLRSRVAANEVSAQATMKQLVTTEQVWRQTDSDRNGSQDYWTNDVAGFYGYRDAVGASLKLVDINVATSDPVGWPTYTVAPFSLPGAVQAKSGFYYTVMTMDETGNPYQTDADGDGFATNLTGFAFCAYPSTYGRTGTHQYIVNEQGCVFFQDLGVAPPTTTWPAADPTLFGWAAAE
ncbi:MAG: type II secretion system protein [Planctomycetota bacterium]